MSYRDEDNSTPVIELRGVKKSYRRGTVETPVLQGIDFTVRPGECAFLVGPSGSGKTTLLSIIGCMLTCDSGVVRVLGDDVEQLPAAARARLRLERIGFVFQRFHLIRGLTAVENVSVPLKLADVPSREAHERAMGLLSAFGLANIANSHPSRMSTGQCQRIALARALANDPALILADEPTSSLDAENGQIVMQQLRRLATELGHSVVVVTHDTRIFHFADHIHRLENGRLVDGGASNPFGESARGSAPPLPVSSAVSPASYWPGLTIPQITPTTATPCG